MAEQNNSINRSSGVNYEDEWRSADPIITMIISAIEIPVMILTLCALCALIKSQRSTPVLVIHLIISDLIQIICILIMTIKWSWEVDKDLDKTYTYSLIAGLYFMACVALERYLLVSHPIWYRTHHSLKVCCVISVIVWFVPLMFADVNYYRLFRPLPVFIGCLIPYPIIILCFIGTCRGLSHAISLTSLKRKKILGSLFLVLVTYTFLILPCIILSFIDRFFPFDNRLLFTIFEYLFDYLLFLNPLTDCVLYMFIRPDVGGLMKSVHCCCRTDTHQDSSQRRDGHSRDSSAALASCVSVLKSASHSRT